MIVIVRIDLDRYDIAELGQLIWDGIITVSEASEAAAFKRLSEFTQLMTVRSWKKGVQRHGNVA